MNGGFVSLLYQNCHEESHDGDDSEKVMEKKLRMAKKYEQYEIPAISSIK